MITGSIVRSSCVRDRSGRASECASTEPAHSPAPEGDAQKLVAQTHLSTYSRPMSEPTALDMANAETRAAIAAAWIADLNNTSCLSVKYDPLSSCC